MDFYRIAESQNRDKTGSLRSIDLSPDFRVGPCEDLMIRGAAFYAVWDEKKGMWSDSAFDVQRLIDQEMREQSDEVRSRTDDEAPVNIKLMSDFSSGSWKKFCDYVKHMPDNWHQLNQTLIFADTPVSRTDYASKRLPYSLQPDGDYSAWDELIGVLYAPEERQKLEWAIGAIVSGESKEIQKFIVLYGEGGTGKSTFLNILSKLFEGYTAQFDAKGLTANGNQFAAEVFASGPLVAIQHDGDLSKIEDNTRLNSLSSHEDMLVNKKYSPMFSIKSNAFIFMGTNTPVRITDAKSGIIRRLIDVEPTGNKLPAKEYRALLGRINFQLGAIAAHCLDVYLKLGKHFYDAYIPKTMIYQTNVFYNYVDSQFDIFKRQDKVSLAQAYEAYKQYCKDSLVDFVLPRHKFREELKNYFSGFLDRTLIDGKQIRSVYVGFRSEKFESTLVANNELPPNIETVETREVWLNWSVKSDEVNCLEELLKNCPAQYANTDEAPTQRWENVGTVLSQLNTRRLHYVKPLPNLIVIDFDLKDATGAKSLQKNLEAAVKWPPTYTETSKSGKGLHLHYLYTGSDLDRLSPIFAPGIEVKVFRGNSSLRRILTDMVCNLPVANLSYGLPLKEVKPLVDMQSLRSETALRNLLKKALKKEIHPDTSSSVNFIHDILEEAYQAGNHFDVRDMQQKCVAFAMHSTHQSQRCVKLIAATHFCSDDCAPPVTYAEPEQPITFFDVEVKPNVTLIVTKEENVDKYETIFHPKPTDVEALLTKKLVGFNNRKYDNHILYAILQGYSEEEIFELSKKIIANRRDALFREAYNLSYADVYDFVSKKQSLKKYEIELGHPHSEFPLDWNEPLPEDRFEELAAYCRNDVSATEAVWHARQADWKARLILSDLSGLTVNDSTNQHTGRLIFGQDRHPQSSFNYRNLAEPVLAVSPEMKEFLGLGDEPEFEAWDGTKSFLPCFPGYKYEGGVSTYRGFTVGEGGFVWAKTGMYGHVTTKDITSMHPTAVDQEMLFGSHTKNFRDLVRARVYIKHKDFDSAKKLFGGKLARYLNDPDEAKGLSAALKIAINSVYGQTFASYDCMFRDPRNKDNIVAKRGALFMVDLLLALQARNVEVIHIKTDSIKVVDLDEDTEQFILDFGKKYGYSFETEHVFDRFCLVNDAVYIAHLAGDDPEAPGTWTATGAQFQHPYVFKALFSHDEITFEDMCETKSCSTALYMDFNEGLPDDTLQVAEKKALTDILEALQLVKGATGALRADYLAQLMRSRTVKRWLSEINLDPDKDCDALIEHIENRLLELNDYIAGCHRYSFVGKAGQFTPVKDGTGGAMLVRSNNNGHGYSAVSGTSGYRWMESEMLRTLNLTDTVCVDYYISLCDAAAAAVRQFGDWDWFTAVRE